MVYCQSCIYNTPNGCKVKEFGKICPLTNAATPVKEHRPTHADRIRAMSDEELADYFSKTFCHGYGKPQFIEWLKQPAEEE